MPATLLVVGGSIFGLLGLLHAWFTFRDIERPRRLVPEDPAVADAMANTGLRLSRGGTTMWRSWVGFNFSHSLGLLVFAAGTIALGLGLGSGSVPQRLLMLPAAIGCIYVLLSLRYWFRAPAAGTALGMLCLVASIPMSSGWAGAPTRGLSPREVIEAKFAAVNRHAVSDIVRFYSPNARITSSGFCSPRQGLADVQRTYQALIEAVPDVVAEVNLYVVDGDRVAVIFTVKGHLQGTSIAVQIANFFTVRNGLIETDDGVYDTGGRPCSP